MPTLTWVGKDKVVNQHHDVPFKVLQQQNRFDAPDDSPANSTDNRIIHGDNLEALKSLLPEFEGKVNCIYIDPPWPVAVLMHPQTCNGNPSKRERQKINGNVKGAKSTMTQAVVTVRVFTNPDLKAVVIPTQAAVKRNM